MNTNIVLDIVLIVSAILLLLIVCTGDFYKSGSAVGLACVVLASVGMTFGLVFLVLDLTHPGGRP